MTLYEQEQKKPTKIQGIEHRVWCIIIQLIHKAQTKRDDTKRDDTKRDDTKRGRKRGGLDGQMDKIIRESVIWDNLDNLEDKIREICFKTNSYPQTTKEKEGQP